MSKYIVEIKPEYEDSFKGVMVLGAKDNDLFVDTLAVDDLELLNSDYINEHYGELQDTAYQKGLEEGKKQAKVQAHLDVCHDIERVAHGNYQKGLDDAWEAARKIVDMWDRIDNDELLAIFGITERIGHSTIKSLFEKQTANEAMLELETYEEKQNDKIVVGDEVNWNSDVIVVTRLYKDGEHDWCDGISKDGIAFHVLAENVCKTGKHFNIASILEDMRND